MSYKSTNKRWLFEPQEFTVFPKNKPQHPPLRGILDSNGVRHFRVGFIYRLILQSDAHAEVILFYLKPWKPGYPPLHE